MTLEERNWFQTTRHRWPKRPVFKGDTYIGYDRSTLIHFWNTEENSTGELPATLAGYDFKRLYTCQELQPSGKLLAIAPEPGTFLPFGNQIPVLAWMYGQWADDFSSMAHISPRNRRGPAQARQASGPHWQRVPHGDIQIVGKLYLYGMVKGDQFPPREWVEEEQAERRAEMELLRAQQEEARREQAELERQLAEEAAALEEQDQTDQVDAYIAGQIALGNTDPEQLARDLRRLGSQVPPPRAALQRTQRIITVNSKTQARKILRRKRKKKK